MRVRDPAELEPLFERDRDVHVYALADLEPPIWHRSEWYRRGDAAVGIIELDGGITTVYAVSAADPAGSLELTIELLDRIAPGTMITGPLGLAAAVAARVTIDDLGVHVKCARRRSTRLPDSSAVVTLGIDDFERVAALHATAPGDAFVLESMLADDTFVGIEDPDHPASLIAAAGTHVVSDRRRVAALGGVLVAPHHRGRGLGAVVSAGVIRRLAGRVDTIALNVAAANVAARRTYRRLGFVDLLEYEEIVVDPG